MGLQFRNWVMSIYIQIKILGMRLLVFIKYKYKILRFREKTMGNNINNLDLYHSAKWRHWALIGNI